MDVVPTMLRRTVPDARMPADQLLSERYEPRELIGSGGIGRVLHAWDRQRRHGVTLKVFDVVPVAPEKLARYADIVTQATRARHPAVVLPLACVYDHVPPFAVFEASTGMDLATLCKRGRGLPWLKAVEIVLACAEALAAVHRATALSHRALKPTNVWITDAGDTRVLDFGTAELAVQPPRERPDGSFVEYRAPEQIEGGPGDERSDVFTLGVLLLEMTTGIPLFSGPSAFQAAHQTLTRTTAMLTAGMSVARLPEPVERFLRKAITQRPEDRFADTHELFNALTIARQAVGATLPQPTARRQEVHLPEQTGPDDECESPAGGSTTLIRIPTPRTKPPSLAAPASRAMNVAVAAAPEEVELGPPPLGSGCQTERDPLAPLNGKAVPAAATSRQTEQLTPLEFENSTTTVFSAPTTFEKTEVLSRPYARPQEQTERLPASRGADEVEPTLVLREPAQPASPQPSTRPVEITLWARRAMPEETLVLSEENERRGAAVDAPTEVKSVAVDSEPATPTQLDYSFLRRLLLAALILGIIIVLMTL